MNVVAVSNMYCRNNIIIPEIGAGFITNVHGFLPEVTQILNKHFNVM